MYTREYATEKVDTHENDKNENFRITPDSRSFRVGTYIPMYLGDR